MCILPRIYVGDNCLFISRTRPSFLTVAVRQTYAGIMSRGSETSGNGYWFFSRRTRSARTRDFRTNPARATRDRVIKRAHRSLDWTIRLLHCSAVPKPTRTTEDKNKIHFTKNKIKRKQICYFRCYSFSAMPINLKVLSVTF